MKEVYFLALGANLCWAMASQVFTFFSRHISSSWTNCFKALIALVAFSLYLFVTKTWVGGTFYSAGLLTLSGLLGLAMGDIFLLKAFSKMGPGRTLILFGFQPLIMGFFGHFIFNQGMDLSKLYAIIFFILCLGTFSFESFKKEGEWGVEGLLMAFLGMLLDAGGLVLTRLAFDSQKALTAMEGNFYRCLGALLGFFLLSRIRPIKLWDNYKALSLKLKLYAIGGSLLGTFLSLALYLRAIQIGHLASLSGLAITGTLFAALFECLIERKWPSKYLLISLMFFLVGMNILLFE